LVASGENRGPDLNRWTKKTLEMASGNYLDKLTEIYPAYSERAKEFSEELRNDIEELRERFGSLNEYQESVGPAGLGTDSLSKEETYSLSKEEEELIDFLYKLREKYGRFAINHPYATALSDPEVRKKNPKAVKLLLCEIRKWGFEAIASRLKAPDELNRLMGNAFKEWLKSEKETGFLGSLKAKGLPTDKYFLSLRSKKTGERKLVVKGTDNDARKKTKISLSKGSEGKWEFVRNFLKELKSGVHIFFGSDEANSVLLDVLGIKPLAVKGIDMVFVVKREAETGGKLWFLFGEAKFQSDQGGNQDNQKIIGSQILTVKIPQGNEAGEVGFFLLDGIPVIKRYEGLFSQDTNAQKKLIFSALLLPDFLKEVYEKGQEAL